MKWFYVISLLVAAMLVLSPMLYLEGGSADEFKGKMVMWDTYGAAIKSVDPATCGDTTSSSIQGNIYEGLYCYHFLKRPPTVIPQLAEKMPKISRDGRTYTIKIKKGVYYHRNPCFGKDPTKKHKWATRELQAKDFELAFKRIADRKITSPLGWALISEKIEGLDDFRKKTTFYKVGDFSRYNLKVKGIEALDKYTLRFRLKKPFPQFIYVLAMSIYAPIPSEAVDYWLGSEDDGSGGRKKIALSRRKTIFTEAEQVVGTGPYTFKTWKRKSKVVYVRNPEFRKDYYPTEGEPGDKKAGLLADAGKRVPFIDVVHLDFVEETYPAWMMFLTKKKDVTGIPKQTFESVITPGKELEKTWGKKGIYLKKYTSPAVYWFVFNMDDKVVGGSKALRQALCLAYDVENYIKVLHNGRGKRAVNILPSTFKGWKEAGPGPYYRMDVKAAKKKLAQAKKELAAAGLLENGKIPELTLDMAGQDADAIQFADFAKQQFAKLGIKLRVIFNDWPTLQQKVHNKQIQIYTMGWHADYPDAENFLQLYYSPNIKKGTNNSNYSNPAFDKLYEKVKVMPDTPKRTKLYAKMVRMISEDCPVLLLSEPQAYVLFYKWMHNVKPHPVGYGFTKYRRIDTKLRKKMGGGR